MESFAVNVLKLEELSGQKDTALQLGRAFALIVTLKPQLYRTTILSGLGKRGYPYGIEN